VSPQEVIAKESYRKFRKSSTFAIRQAAVRLSPSDGTTFQTTFPPYRLVKVS